MRYPFVQQHDEKDCGAACLSMICEYYGKKMNLATIRERIKVDAQGANIYGLVTGAKSLSLCADALEGDPAELEEAIRTGEIKLPFIARIITKTGLEHFIVVYRIGKRTVLAGDPGRSGISRIRKEEFFASWQQQIVTFEPDKTFVPCNERAGTYSRYLRLITSQRKMLLCIFLASLIISGINLFGSVIFQYILSSADPAMGQKTIYPVTYTEENGESADTGSGKVLALIEWSQGGPGIIFRNIKTICITIILLYLLRCLIMILRGILLSEATKRVHLPLSLGYFDHLMKLPYDFFGTRKAGEFMSRFTDINKIRDSLSSTALTIMLDTIMAASCGIMLLYISGRLFLITLAVLAVYCLIVFLFKRTIAHVNYEYMESDALVTAHLKESVDGIETIKAYQCEDHVSQKLGELFQRLMRHYTKGSVTYSLQEALVGTVASVGTVILLWSGARLCMKGSISIADLLIYYYLIGYFIDPVRNLINLQPKLQTAAVAASRLNDVIDAQTEEESYESRNGALSPEHENREPASIGDIDIRDLTFRYGNRDTVLDHISLKISQGSKVAIVGESGCGKTTLVKLLLGFYPPETGEILYSGCSIENCPAHLIRNKISYVSQNIFLFADTILYNLTLGDGSISRERAEEVCRLCRIHEDILRLPMGYDTVLEENGANLSGGQKQRLAIARAILRDPDLLIFDEATSHLDALTEHEVSESLDRILKGKTCIFIAHRLKTIRSCDRIFVMDHGTIIEEGTHDALMAANGRYASYFEDF